MSNLLQNNYDDDSFFTKKDHMMWEKLYHKQTQRLQNLASNIFLENLNFFQLPTDEIPKIKEVSERLYDTTGWKISPVKGLVDYETYFSLLQNRLFPAAMFIRKDEEENLSKDPDIFHEIFGHCTMLLSQDYADFMQNYAKFALTVKKYDRALFARLIWFTTETALIHMNNQLKIFGSSVISSYDESYYAIHSDMAIRKPFDIVSIFREPYRADLMQKVYYVLDDVQQVYSLIHNTTTLYAALNTARQLGEFNPLFEISKSKYANINHCHTLNADILT